MIRIENLTKKYGDLMALNNINLKFDRGKVYGIVGENGAGKTTLFRCIAGFENYSGTISADINPLKDHLGYLSTESYFFNKITGREYVQLFCNARKIKLENLENKNIFDLPLEQYASTYSTGMKKKLALTAILLLENEYYILDEPFNGVDIQSNIIITEIIIKLKSLGKTIIMSSHIFSTLSESCDAIHLLKRGELIKSVFKDDFLSLEKGMKEVLIGNKIERLGLR